jgi:hypothetical protein
LDARASSPDGALLDVDPTVIELLPFLVASLILTAAKRKRITAFIRW